MVKQTEYLKQLKNAIEKANWFSLHGMKKELIHLLSVIDALLNKKPIPMIPKNLFQRIFKIKKLSKFQKSLKDSRAYVFKLQRFELIPHQIDMYVMLKNIDKRLKHPFKRKTK